MEIGPRRRDEPIGCFDSLAFIKVPGYVGQEDNKRSESIMELEEDKAIVKVFVNTEAIKLSIRFILLKEDTVERIFKELREKSNGLIINPKNYTLLPVYKQG